MTGIGRRIGVVVTTVLWGLAAAAPGESVSPKRWTTRGADAWSAAKLDSVGVSSRGAVALTLGRERVLDGESVVWVLLPDGDGVLAGTGNGGALVRIDRDGTSREVGRIVQPEITALGRDDRGAVLAGASPDGVVYRMNGSTIEFLVDTPETYVWSILPHPRGGAWIATGNAGKVYRVDGEGALSLVADTRTEHVFGMVPSGDDLLLATGSPSRILRLTGGGNLEVLHEGDDDEFKRPLPGPEGTVYFAGNRADPQSPEGWIYRRNSAGAVERIWSTPGAYIYDLQLDGSGMLWAATGANGATGTLVRVEPGPPSAWREMLTVPEGKLLSVAFAGDRPAWAGTGGGLGRVYRITDGAAPEGVATGPVGDAGSPARWGVLTVEPGPEFPGLTVETRSGNTSTADDTWSPWTAVPLHNGVGPIQSPAARRLEWRLRLSDSSTEVTGVEVAYLPANRAPRVDEVLVSELGAAFDRPPDRGSPGALGQNLPGGLRVDFQVNAPPSNNEASDLEAAWARRFRSITWKIAEPDEDPVTVALEIRSLGEPGWAPLAKDLERSPWVWDSATVSDGWYELRLTASDERGNPAGEALRADRASDPFLVDNTAPTIAPLTVRDGMVAGEASDASSAIKGLAWSLDGGPWIAVRPEDGIADERREAFTVSLRDVAAGTHVIHVRAVDRAGNLATASARFEAR